MTSGHPNNTVHDGVRAPQWHSMTSGHPNDDVWAHPTLWHHPEPALWVSDRAPLDQQSSPTQSNHFRLWWFFLKLFLAAILGREVGRRTRYPVILLWPSWTVRGSSCTIFFFSVVPRTIFNKIPKSETVKVKLLDFWQLAPPQVPKCLS